MFRFLHAADLHLDSPLRGLASRGDDSPVEALRGATRRALDKLIELALEKEVDLVVIAGDVYDRDWKDYQTALFFRSRMHRLSERGIPVFLISGNHDAASVISRKLSLPENVRHFSSKAPETVEPEDLPIAVHGMSFPNRAVDENLVPRYPEPVKGKFNLGILHTSLAGSENHDTYAPCSLDDLIGKGYDYWALGHIHQPAVLHESPWIVYPGNIQGRHARECGERGCRVIEVNDGLEVCRCDWHSLDVARWASVVLDIGGVEAFDEVVNQMRGGMRKAVEEADGRLLALRIQLSGATPLHGQLCSRPDQIEAEAMACADEFGEDAVWVEKVKILTRRPVSLEELADRDVLTKVVVEALNDSNIESDELPAEVNAMLEGLPADLRESLAREWADSGRRPLIEDACSLILDRLTTEGGEAT